MTPDPNIYGVIVEWKTEGPLIMESKPMNYAQASIRMKEMERNCGVIRVAIFSMIHQSGHETLIEKES